MSNQKVSAGLIDQSGDFNFTGELKLKGSPIVSSVDSIKSLSVPTVTGQSFSVTGFYAGTTVGGGDFIYDASRGKADHNGGTVIAPEAIAAWDGSQVNLASLLNWTGAGSGCFVRRGGSSKMVDFGGIADGFSDNLPAYNAARIANAGGTVYLDFNALAYATSSGFVVGSNEKLLSFGGMARIKSLGDHDAITITSGGSEVSGFMISTEGNRESSSTNGIRAYSATGNIKTNIHDIKAESAFNTFILLDCEADQSEIHNIVSFKNHFRGAIDVATKSAASAPTGAAKIYNIWVTPIGYAQGQVPSLFGVRVCRTDSCEISNSIINDNQNDILIDNKNGVEANWNLNISSVHMENRWYANNSTPPNRWTESSSVSLGDIIIPTKNKANGYVYKAQNSGTSGVAEPAWQVSPEFQSELNVNDNDVVWVPYYSVIGIRVNGLAISSLVANSVQIDNKISAIQDTSTNWIINSLRVFGLAADNWYKKTVNTSSNNILTINNSKTTGNFLGLIGSSRAVITGSGNDFSLLNFGIQSIVNDNVNIANSRDFTYNKPSIINLENGVESDVVTFSIPNNSQGYIELNVSASVQDSAFNQRSSKAGALLISYIRPSSGAMLVSLVDTIPTNNISGTNSMVFSAQVAGDLLKLRCLITTSITTPLTRVSIQKISTGMNVIDTILTA